MRKQSTITIKVTGNNDNINQLLAIASTLNIECETIDAGAVASEPVKDTNKASKPVKASKSKKGISEETSEVVNSLTETQKKAVEKYKNAGCIGYVIINKVVKPIARYDEKNKGYRLAKVNRGNVVKTKTGAIDTIYDDKEFQKEKSDYLSKQHEIHKKCPKDWKLNLYRKLGYYLTSAQEKTMIIF